MSYVNEIARAFAQPERVRGGSVRLMAEFVAFYLLVPVLFAVFVPSHFLFPALFAFMAVGLVLLHFSPGFSWQTLLWSRPDLRFVAGVGVLSTLGIAAAVLWLRPEAFLGIPRHNPRLMAAIALFYPLLSALPQELVFRVLYFRRYDAILPKSTLGMWLNAGVFSLAHLMYWNWVAVGITFLGGLAFAFGYKRRGGFATAFLLHAVTGLMLFALGLGAWFYSGAVVRPF